MLKYLVAVFVASLFVATLAEDNKDNRYFFDNRPPTGKFITEPYAKVYQHYAVQFMRKDYEGTGERPHDNYRNYRPSPEECLVFFDKFKVREYQLDQLVDLVLLDGCLGYLYDEAGTQFHEQDKNDSRLVAEKLDIYIEDEKLKELYTTRIEDLSEASQICVGNLFTRLIQAIKQFKDTPNNQQIYVLNHFAMCQRESGLRNEVPETDPYVGLLYKNIRVLAKKCFEAEVRHTNTAINAHFKSQPYSVLIRKIASVTDGKSKQTLERSWPIQVVTVLDVLLRQTREYNLRNGMALIRGFNQEHPAKINSFLKNLQIYINKDFQKVKKDEDKYYDQKMNKVCEFFRSTNDRKSYDFSTAFSRLADMLEYEDVYGIDNQLFTKHILNQAYETAPAYIGFVGCQIIAKTYGVVARDPVGNKMIKVSLQKNWQNTLRKWPDAGFY